MQSNIRQWIAYLFLSAMATLPSACSVDVTKLRPLEKADGAVGYPSLPDSYTASPDIGPDRGVPDVWVGSPDLVPANEVASPVEVSTTTDLGVEKDATNDVDPSDSQSPLDTESPKDTGKQGNPDSVIATDTAIDGAVLDSTTDSAIDTGSAIPVQDPDLVLWYKFDEVSGTIAADSALWNNIARNATLTTMGVGGSAVFSTDSQVGTHALNLTSSTSAYGSGGGYALLPSLQNLAPSAITIAVWINLANITTTQNWERIFDFGINTGVYMYLTPRALVGYNNPIRFAITTQGNSASYEQRLDSTAGIGANTWHHIAIVLQAGSPYTGTMYLNGMSVATNTNMTLHASDLGATTNNWLGRSQFSGAYGTNPCFSGSLDDFRVYRRALSQQEIVALMTLR